MGDVTGGIQRPLGFSAFCGYYENGFTQLSFGWLLNRLQERDYLGYLSRKGHLTDSGIRHSVAGEKDRFSTTSAVFKLIGMTFAITAAALEAVDLKHLEILRRKGL